MNNRFKNPWFWIGLVGVILTAMGISPETLTTWNAVAEAFKGLITNPYMLVSVAMAVIGVFVEPTSKGLKDGKNEH